MKQVLVFIFLSSICISFGQSQKEKLQKNANKLEKELRNLSAEINNTKASKKTNYAKLNNLEKRIVKRTEVLHNLDMEATIVQRSIEKTEQDITTLELKIKTLKNEYIRVIRKSYKKKNKENKLLALLGAESLSQAYKRAVFMKRYSTLRKEQVKELKASQEKLEKTKQQLVQQQREKSSLLHKQKKSNSQLLKEKEEKEFLLKSLTKKEKNLVATLKRKQREKANANRKIRQLIQAQIKEQQRLAKIEAEKIRKAEEKKKAAEKTTKTTKTTSKPTPAPKTTPKKSYKTPAVKALSSSFSNNRGKLPWPLKKGNIISKFGKQPYPGLPGIFIENGGIEIECPSGSTVYSVYEGTVTAVYSINSSKAILIQHGEYYTLYFNVKNISVTRGQRVERMQSIGTAAKDPIDNKTKIEFQIWKNKTKLNPQYWIVN